MFSKVHFSVLFFLVFSTDLSLRAQQTLKPFSANETSTINGETYSAKIYSDGHSVRSESADNAPGQSNVTFVRLDSGLTQVVIRWETAYSEYPYGGLFDGQFVS